MRILIAVDDRAERRTLRSTLEGWGYDVVEAEDGSEALAVLSSAHPPALAILGEETESVDALTICREIRKRPQGSYVYVILLAGSGDRGDRIDGLESGADECLVRPYDARELRARLRVGRRIVDLQDELVSAREAIRAQASRDSLTRVLNRGAILDALEREVARAERLGEPLGILLGDLDHFKTVNDVHGHLVGDSVLREAATRMAGSVRPYDAVGRYGGEEFLITLPGCDGARAMVVAERLRAAVSKTPFRCVGIDLDVTVSLGIAVFAPGSSSRIDTLVGAADSALYRAKAEGRNRSIVAPTSVSSESEGRIRRRPAGAAQASADPGDSHVAPVDLSRLREICCDDDALRAELLDLFLVSTAPRLPALREALEAGNATRAEGEADAIKGAATHLGAAQLGDLAFRLERLARMGDLSTGPDVMRDLEAEFRRVRVFVERLQVADPAAPDRPVRS